MRRGIAVPVWMYHDIADDPDAVPVDARPYVVSSKAFRDQLRLLAGLGIEATRLDAALDTGDGGLPSSRRCVLTFDDGHESNCTRALASLVEADCKATFFVTVGWIGRARYMSWDQIKTLAAAGMEIGSHSMTHRPPSTLTPAELLAEMSESKQRLEDRLGLPVLTASSPTGFYNPGIIAAARAAGYKALCYGRIALWRDRGDAFRIPRLPIKRWTTPAEIRALALGRRSLIARLRLEQMARNGLKTALGVEGYLRLRRALLGLSTAGRGDPPASGKDA